MNSLLYEWQYKWLGLKGCWHLDYYNPADHPPGSISGSLLDFKEKVPSSVTKWNNQALADLKSTKINFHCIVRALGSKELQASGQKALDSLGYFLGTNLGASYLPMILTKVRATKPLHTLKLAERQKEMKNAYLANPGNYSLNGQNILILDDITTTNTTIKEILRALKVEWPKAHYYFFCLGRTKRDD